VAIALSTKGTEFDLSVTAGLVIGLLVGFIFIGIERLTHGFTLRGFSTATFGLGVGLFCAWLLTRVELSALIELALRSHIERAADGELLVDSLRLALDVTLFASLGFLGAALALRGNREDFAFIIPYVRFREDASSGQPIVLDSETVMDSRILGLIGSGFISGRLIIPDYVLEDVQTLSSGAEEAVSLRAKRGLENLEKMQGATEIQVSIHESRIKLDEKNFNTQLIETTQFFNARLLTLDEGLTKVAKLQGVSVLNLNDLDKALRPIVEVGANLHLALVRPGKEPHQAVGYLPDGTMIVVNHASEDIGVSMNIVVTSTLQTASGTLVFAEKQRS